MCIICVTTRTKVYDLDRWICGFGIWPFAIHINIYYADNSCNNRHVETPFIHSRAQCHNHKWSWRWKWVHTPSPWFFGPCNMYVIFLYLLFQISPIPWLDLRKLRKIICTSGLGQISYCTVSHVGLKGGGCHKTSKQ